MWTTEGPHRNAIHWRIEMAKRLLTACQMANCLSLEESTIRRWARKGLIPWVKPTPKVIRFDAADVVRALKERSREAETAADGPPVEC